MMISFIKSKNVQKQRVESPTKRPVFGEAAFRRADN